MLGLPSDALSQVDSLLPQQAEDRARWALWTYERRDPLVSGVAASWMGQPWVERVRFSSLLPLIDIWYALDRAARRAGVRVLSFSPSSATATVLTESKDDPGPEPTVRTSVGIGSGASEEFVEWKPRAIPIPTRLRVRIAAAIAATMHPTPPIQSADIRLPTRWTWGRMPLDDKDRSDLASAALVALTRLSMSDVSEGEPSASIFWRLIENEARASRGDSKRAEYQTKRRSLETEFVRTMGLTALRPGGRSQILTEANLQRLIGEAAEIVEAVQTWEPPGPLFRWTRAALEEDEEVLEQISDPLEYGRVRRVLRGASSEERALSLARAVRFAFLTGEEIRLSLERRPTNEVGLALVRSRLAANVSTKALQELA